ncbi:MAG: hypothetical protein ACLFTK_13975 [Anaerolineales bacterium]
MMLRVWSILIVLLSGTGALFVSAQTDDSALVISAETVQNLRSHIRLDFEAVRARGLSPGSGLFVTDADASWVVSFANAPDEPPLSTAIVWDGQTGELQATLFIGENQYDRALSVSGELLAVARQDGAALFNLQEDALISENVLPPLPEPIITHVWFAPGDVICGETGPAAGGTSYVVCSDNRAAVAVPLGGLDVVRIGRVPLPLAVTAQEDGQVTRWNLAEGTPTATANAGDIAVFGAINISGNPFAPESGTHLAWRDPTSQALHLLDFQTGQNQTLAALDGDYIAHIQVARGADVVFGIDPASARGTISAWTVPDGTRYDLGAFRACTRQQPDMARVSPDGTALVIGCDEGLDIWRVQP